MTDALAPRLLALVKQWRVSADHIESNHPGDRTRWDPDTLRDCAQELTAALLTPCPSVKGTPDKS